MNMVCGCGGLCDSGRVCPMAKPFDPLAALDAAADALFDARAALLRCEGVGASESARMAQAENMVRVALVLVNEAILNTRHPDLKLR